MIKTGTWAFVLAALAIVLTATSCKKKKTLSNHKPDFRVHNFSPGSPPVYFTLDGWQNTGDPVSYLGSGPAYSEYPYDNTGSQQLKISSQASNATYLQETVQLQDYYTYSIFSCNIFTSMEYLVVPVYNDPSNNYGKCKIRFVNLCPNADSIKVVQGTDTLYTNVRYKSATDYIEIPAGSKMTTILSASNAFLFSDRMADYNSMEVKDIVLSGFINAADTAFRPKLTLVKEY